MPPKMSHIEKIGDPHQWPIILAHDKHTSRYGTFACLWGFEFEFSQWGRSVSLQRDLNLVQSTEQLGDACGFP